MGVNRRLLFILDKEWDGNSSLAIIGHRWTAGLQKKGWDLRILAPCFSDSIPEENVVPIPHPYYKDLMSRLRTNLKKIFHPAGSYWQWANQCTDKAGEIAGNFQPDGIYAMGFVSHFIANQCFQRFNIPYIVDMRDTWTVNLYLQAFPWHSRWKKELKNLTLRNAERKILRQARFIFFLAEQVRQPYIQVFRLPQEKTEILYNAWNPEEQEMEMKKSEEKRGKLCILFGGSLPAICRQNLRNFLLAFQALTYLHSEVQMSLCFQDWAEETEKYVRTLPLSCTVVFSHHLSLKEFHRKVSEADICLTIRSDSPFDYGCNRLFSYMLFRKPTIVIAHPFSTEGELLRKTGLGWVVHPADIEGMKRVLREIYEKWKQNAPFVQPDEEEIRKFSLPVQVEKLSQILNSILKLDR